MDINSVASVESASSLRTLSELQNETSNSTLGKDAFLNILVSQLSNQNPLEPTSDTEFVAQLAQFSMLEQLQNLTDSFTTSQSYDLVGKYVYVETEPDNNSETEVIFGKVDGVIKRDGIDYLLVGDKQYFASDVTGVVDSLSDNSSIDENILQSANLIGKIVTAEYEGEDEQTATVTGTVEKITINNGEIYAYVDGQQIAVSDIQEISEQDSLLI